MLDKFMLAEAFNLAEDAEEFTLDPTGLNDLDSFLDAAGTDPEEDFIDVIDPEAQAEEDLQQSYIGKVITNCNICHSDIFVDKDAIEISEDGVVNPEAACPYCGSIGDGYVIVGEVQPFHNCEDGNCEDETEIEIDIDHDGEEDIEIEIEGESNEVEENEFEESLDEEEKEELKEAITVDQHFVLRFDNPEEAEAARTRLADLGYDIGTEFAEDGEIVFEIFGGSNATVDDFKALFGESFSGTITESIEDVTVGTEDETMTMTTKEDGGVIIETTPKDELEGAELEGEMIAPLDEFDKEEIIDNVTAEDEEEAMADLDAAEFDEISEEEEIEDFDEESFDGLGESYLKRCYDNVNSFKTTSVGLNEGVLTVEGTIGFTSGNEKTTKFVFEGVTKENKQKLCGFNEQISRGKKSFKLGCKNENGKLVCESLNYNYKSKNDNDDSIRVYGTVRKAK